MQFSRRDAVDIAFVLALFVFVVVASLLRVEFADTLQYKDGWWYLSRAWQHTHGIFDHLSFYTLAYPLLVGAINWLVYDLPLSGMIANAIILLFMAFGIYLIGRLFFSRAVALSSVFIFMLNGRLLYHIRMFNADLLFMAAVTWMVIIAALLVRTTRRVWAVVLAVLVGMSPYIRFESLIHGTLVLAVAAIFYKAKCGSQTLIKQALTIGVIVGLLWLTYAIWFLSGADNLANATYSQAIDRLESWLQNTASTYQPLDWVTVSVGILGLIYSFTKSRHRLRKREAALKLGFLIVPAALVPIYVTFASPVPDFRFAFHVLPCLAIIYGIVVSRLYQSKAAATLVSILLCIYALTALEAVRDLPSPMSFQSDASAVAARHASINVQLWKRRNGYQNATTRTICTNLMIFAQFDLRLPFTTLSFSSKESSPPRRVLPSMAERSELLLVCPISEIPMRNIERRSPWIELYKYLNTTPVLSENDPLEEIGRIGEYRIYRVKPEVAGRRQLAEK